MILRGAGLFARARPWPGRPDIAHLVTLDQQRPVPSFVLRSWLNELLSAGYAQVRSGALAPAHRPPYEALGFRLAQELTLLHLDLRSDAGRAARQRERRRRAPTRAARSTELPVLADVDISAFPPGWGLDATGLSDAADATPASRIRVATDEGGGVVGLAISGRSGGASFLQRLAVAPVAQRQSAATALVADAVCWAHRWRARTMAVNTQRDNTPALALYHGFGFRDSEMPLVVLERPLNGEL